MSNFSNIKGSKVILIGDGAVGSSFAYNVALNKVVAELGIIDIKKERVVSDIEDLQDSMLYQNYIKVFSADYKDCKDADIVVLTIGVPVKIGQSRLDTLKDNIEIIKEITHSVMESGFDGIFVVVSNPVDITTYAIQKFSKLPAHRVIGTGTSLDTSRYIRILSEYFDVEPKSIYGYVIGEHGDSQFPVYSKTFIGGKSIDTLFKEKGLSSDIFDELRIKTRDTAKRIKKGKGATSYGIGSCTAKIVESILRDEDTIIPVSVKLTGQYGISDVYLSLPAVINRQGIKEIIDIELNQDELQKLKTSADLLKGIIEENKDRI